MPSDKASATDTARTFLRPDCCYSHWNLLLLLFGPIVLSWTLLFAAFVTAAALSPTYSAPHVYLVLCGTLPGYAFAALILAWALHVGRVCWGGARCLIQCVRGSRGRRYSRLLATGMSSEEEKDGACISINEEDDDSVGVSNVMRPISKAGDLASSSDRSYDDHNGLILATVYEHDEEPYLADVCLTDATTCRSMLVWDCVAIVTIYVLSCLLAWWFWAPPTFDVAALKASIAMHDDSTAASLLTFPPTFKFGAATSSYQVEGNIFNNQWAEFELDDEHYNATGKHRIKGGQRCGAAADLWNRFESDLRERIVDDLNLDAYRFSVEWARIEPRRGEFDEAALDKYASWVAQLRDAGVEPIVTLHHFTNPVWFERLGAFENETAPELMLPFARRVVEWLSPHVDYWITFNEIMVYAGQGYLNGDFPPARSGELGTMLRVVANMLRTHGVLYEAIKEIVGPENAKVSIAKNAILYQPWSFADLFAVVSASVSDLYYNAMPVRVLRRQGTLDYMGINTYVRLKVGLMGASMGYVYAPERQSDMGWDLDPQVLHRVVRQYHAYAPELDIIITEHGAADGDNPDLRRISFLRESLVGLALAINCDGVPVVGYMHWSLLDNWEWSSGYEPKFGLYTVDLPSNQERILTEGGKLYREVIAKRRVPV